MHESFSRRCDFHSARPKSNDESKDQVAHGQTRLGSNKIRKKGFPNESYGLKGLEPGLGKGILTTQSNHDVWPLHSSSQPKTHSSSSQKNPQRNPSPNPHHIILTSKVSITMKVFFFFTNRCSNNFLQLSYELRIINLSEVIFLWYATEKSCKTFELLSVYMLYQCWKMSQIHLSPPSFIKSMGMNSIW